jgi:hypothetical protein
MLNANRPTAAEFRRRARALLSTQGKRPRVELGGIRATVAAPMQNEGGALVATRDATMEMSAFGEANFVQNACRVGIDHLGLDVALSAIAAAGAAVCRNR